MRTRGKKGQPDYKGKQLEIRKDGKANAMTSVSGDSMAMVDEYVRKLTPIECERLQSLPDNFTEYGDIINETGGEIVKISNTQRYKMCGNGFNKEVVKHISKNIK